MHNSDELSGRRFAPGRRKYFEPDLDTMEIGAVWYVESGLGGVYKVSFTGMTELGKYEFKVLNKDQEHFFALWKESLHRQLFVYPPESEAA